MKNLEYKKEFLNFSFISTLILNMGFSPVMLPTVNFVAMNKDVEKVETYYSKYLKTLHLLVWRFLLYLFGIEF